MADLIVKEEPFSYKLAAEMEALVRDFFSKSEAGKDRPPLDYNWPHYEALHSADVHHIYTAREDGRLVGFGQYTRIMHPAHQTVQFAICELLGVQFEERGRGIGRKIVEFAEQELRKLGVSRMVQGDRYYKGVTSLFEKMPGFVLVERHYMKVIAPELEQAGSSAS